MLEIDLPEEIWLQLHYTLHGSVMLMALLCLRHLPWAKWTPWIVRLYRLLGSLELCTESLKSTLECIILSFEHTQRRAIKLNDYAKLSMGSIYEMLMQSSKSQWILLTAHRRHTLLRCSIAFDEFFVQIRWRLIIFIIFTRRSFFFWNLIFNDISYSQKNKTYPMISCNEIYAQNAFFHKC